MCHSFGDITTFGQLAAILDFRHKVASAIIAEDLDASYEIINSVLFLELHVYL